MKCPICGASMHQSTIRSVDWLMQCSNCKLESSNLSAGVGAEILGIEGLRRKNFEVILELVKERLDLTRSNSLEVGCSRGSFLDTAKAYGLDCIGIEPDTTTADEARQRGHVVHNDVFPDALANNSLHSFDIVFFNDVFEHLPNILAAKKAVYQHLKPGGLVVLNLPNSDGFLFKLAKLFATVGWRQPLERLWQKGLASPHLNYFNPRNTEKFFSENGDFELLAVRRLDSMQVFGLWTRLRTGGQSFATSMLMYFPLVLAAMLSRLLPGDIQLLVFRRMPPLKGP